MAKFEEIKSKMINSDFSTQSINLFQLANVDNIGNLKAQKQYENEFNQLTGKFLLDSLQGKWENKYEHVILEEVQSLDNTARGEKGFGSTGY